MNLSIWTDESGKVWNTPQILGRLKFRIPSHLALRNYVIQRDGSACKKCGGTVDLIADHIISRKNGGSHHPSNLQCLCQSCNSAKGSRSSI